MRFEAERERRISLPGVVKVHVCVHAHGEREKNNCRLHLSTARKDLCSPADLTGNQQESLKAAEMVARCLGGLSLDRETR